MVLEAAINGQADAIVTYNVADFAGAGERFAISIIRPVEPVSYTHLAINRAFGSLPYRTGAASRDGDAREPSKNAQQQELPIPFRA